MAKKRKRTRGDKEVSPPYQVFVSHATSDKWIARQICEKIEAQGAEYFRDDRDINGGDEIPEAIKREISRSRELVVLLTPDSHNRPWVLLEVGAAWGRGKRIVAILCHVATDVIPETIRGKKAISLNDLDQYLEELRKRIQRVS